MHTRTDPRYESGARWTAASRPAMREMPTQHEPLRPVPPDTVADLLSPDDAGPALITVDGESIDHAALRAEVDRLAGAAAAAGLRPGDRIAIVLPNGPEMALVLLAAMSVGCAAPLNPKYREEEFRFYLDDLRAAALVTDGQSPGRTARPRRTATIAIDVRGDGLSIDLAVSGREPRTRRWPSDRPPTTRRWCCTRRARRHGRRSCRCVSATSPARPATSPRRCSSPHPTAR